ncbi:MAG TPA: hypothetical protein VIJ88_02265 [Candidatus Paceibacterota bacterium]
MKNKLIYIIGGSIVAGSLMLGGNAFAAESSRNWSGTRPPKSSLVHSSTAPAIFGSVTAVSGADITVSGKSGKQGTTTIYTVDVSKAKITKGLGQGASAVAPSNVEVGDKVAVLGNVTGDAVFASAVFDKGAAASGKNRRSRS